jgi:hypothetical protein
MWWPVGGSDAVVASRRRAPTFVVFFSFFVLFAVRLNSGARQTMLHAVWTPSKLGRRLLAFLCRALHITHGK